MYCCYIIRDAIYFSVLILKMCFKESQRRFCANSKSKKLDPKFLSGRPSHVSERPSVSRSFIQFKIASVRTTWQYRPDANQSSRRIRFSFSDTNMGRQLHASGRQVYTVRTSSLIRQDVKRNCNRSDVKATLSIR